MVTRAGGSLGDTRFGGETSGRVVAFERLERGATVGRYVVLDELGAGGMGVVYAAYDPELDRRVALKLLHPTPEMIRAARTSSSGTSVSVAGAPSPVSSSAPSTRRSSRRASGRGTEGHKRLLREAQAIAKLSHPNVVVVHDVGTHGAQVFVAMEFIEGETLAAWMGSPRPWRAVLDVMLQAGRGLSAAHDKGLVHRDFKPDNVMIGTDGRARVLDFGLARPATGGRAPAQARDPLTTPIEAALADGLTRGGSMQGTPAYMAPEQFLDETTDARTDQFAFCVVFWEALYGERPFAGESVSALAFNVGRGELRTPPAPRARAVPSWLHRAVVQGLLAEPDRRHASMKVLLDALEVGIRRERSRRWVAGVGLAVAASLAVAGGWQWQRGQARAACVAEGEAIAAGWDDEPRDAVLAGLAAPGRPPMARNVEARAVPLLDDYAAALTSGATEACRAGEIERRWTPEFSARARWCLTTRRAEFEALTETLVDPDAQTLQNAVQAAASLPAVDGCVDETALARMAPPPSAAAVPELREALGSLARAKALRREGKYPEANAAADAALTSAEAVEAASVAAAALLELGQLHEVTGEFDAAVETLERAYRLAAEAEDAAMMADVATTLAMVTGYYQAKYEVGRLWATQAEVALLVRGEDPLREANRLAALAAIEIHRGDRTDLALELAERALQLRRDELGADHPDVAKLLNNTGTLLLRAGRFERSAEALERTLALQRRALGPEHPETGHTLTSLATAKHKLGAFDEALALHAEALEILEGAFGEHHHAVAMAYNNIGSIHQQRGDYEAATPPFERSLAIAKNVYGPEHPSTYIPLNNLAIIALQRGDFETGVARFEEALALGEKAYGSDHPATAVVRVNLADALELQGDWPRAQTLFSSGIESAQAALGPRHPTFAQLLCERGQTYADRGDYETARRDFQRALEVAVGLETPQATIVGRAEAGMALVELEQGSLDAARRHADAALKAYDEAGAVGDPAERARASWVAGRVRWAQGEHGVARAQVEAAREAFASAGPMYARESKAAATWLASHGD